MKKAVHIIFSAAFCAVLFGMMLGSLLRERDTISYYENRALAHFPTFTWEDFWSGQYFSDIDSAVDDHLIGRDYFMKASTAMDIAVGRPVVSGMIMPEHPDGPLVNFYGYRQWDFSWKRPYAEEMGQRLGALNDTITGYGGYFLYVGVPQQDSYFVESYPAYMDNRDADAEDTRNLFFGTLAEHEVPYVDIKLAFDADDSVENLFFKTDHHYNYYGALVTYRTMLARVNSDTGLGITILQDEDLVFASLPNPYLGSRNRRIYGLAPDDEKIIYAVPKEDIPYSRWDTGYDAGGEIYALPDSDEVEIAYTTYMGNDIPETVITTNRPELPNCLIFGDSFTNAVETLLWTGFNETRSLDLRHYTLQTLKDYVEEWQPDVVICLRDEGAYLTLTGNGQFD